MFSNSPKQQQCFNKLCMENKIRKHEFCKMAIVNSKYLKSPHHSVSISYSNLCWKSLTHDWLICEVCVFICIYYFNPGKFLDNIFLSYH